MQWFVVKYRKPDGTMAEAEFEAADRNALFKILSEKKLSAINITAGRLGKKRFTKNLTKTSSRKILHILEMCILCIVVVGVFVAVRFWFVNNGKTQEESPEKKPKRHTVVSDAIVDTVKAPKGVRKESAKANEPWVHPLMVGKDPYNWVVITNSSGKEKCVRLFHPGSKQKPPIFKHMSENELQEICLGEMGERVPDIPLNSRFRDDLTQALLEPVEISDDDSEDIVVIKQQMQELKDELKAAIKNGEDPIELIREAMEERNRVAAYRENMLQILADRKNEGASQEELDELRAAANKMLSDKGVKLLRTADQIRENIRIKQLEKEQKGEL